MRPSFGELMRKARKDAGVSLRAFAKMAKRSAVYIYEMEQGSRRAPPENNEALFKALAKISGHEDWKWWCAQATCDRHRPDVSHMPKHVADFVIELSDACHELTDAQIMLARDAISHGKAKVA